MKKQTSKKFGMTLVELLVTMTILSVIATAIYGTLHSGLKIWKKVNQPLVYEDLDIFFDRFRNDLKNCITFSGVQFAGTEDKLEFPTVFASPDFGGNAVGRVVYVYDSQAKTITRLQQDLSQIYTGEDTSKMQPIPDLASVKFKYYVYNKETKEYAWQEDALDGNLPVAVKIELESGYGPQAQTFTRTINIPLAG